MRQSPTPATRNALSQLQERHLLERSHRHCDEAIRGEKRNEPQTVLHPQTPYQENKNPSLRIREKCVCVCMYIYIYISTPSYPQLRVLLTLFTCGAVKTRMYPPTAITGSEDYFPLKRGDSQSQMVSCWDSILISELNPPFLIVKSPCLMIKSWFLMVKFPVFAG